MRIPHLARVLNYINIVIFDKIIFKREKKLLLNYTITESGITQAIIAFGMLLTRP